MTQEHMVPTKHDFLLSLNITFFPIMLRHASYQVTQDRGITYCFPINPQKILSIREDTEEALKLVLRNLSSQAAFHCHK